MSVDPYGAPEERAGPNCVSCISEEYAVAVELQSYSGSKYTIPNIFTSLLISEYKQFICSIMVIGF